MKCSRVQKYGGSDTDGQIWELGIGKNVWNSNGLAGRVGVLRCFGTWKEQMSSDGKKMIRLGVLGQQLLGEEK